MGGASAERQKNPRIETGALTEHGLPIQGAGPDCTRHGSAQDRLSLRQGPCCPRRGRYGAGERELHKASFRGRGPQKQQSRARPKKARAATWQGVRDKVRKVLYVRVGAGQRRRTSRASTRSIGFWGILRCRLCYTVRGSCVVNAEQAQNMPAVLARRQAQHGTNGDEAPETTWAARCQEEGKEACLAQRGSGQGAPGLHGRELLSGTGLAVITYEQARAGTHTQESEAKASAMAQNMQGGS